MRLIHQLHCPQAVTRNAGARAPATVDNPALQKIANDPVKPTFSHGAAKQERVAPDSPDDLEPEQRPSQRVFAAELATVGGSRVLEIDPTTGKVVWSYTADNSDQPLWAFRSAFISSARRLSNGNTLIDDGMNGRFFQVTPAGEIVWEYVSPYFAKTSAAVSGRAVTSNWVYRARPVPYDWAPAGTLREETAVTPPGPADFHIKAGA